MSLKRQKAVTIPSTGSRPPICWIIRVRTKNEINSRLSGKGGAWQSHHPWAGIPSMLGAFSRDSEYVRFGFRIAGPQNESDTAASNKSDRCIHLDVST